MWDCQSDNNALYFLYGIRLAGVVDLQLHCLAWSLNENPADEKTKQTFRSLHWALATANHAGMGPEERKAYSHTVQMARILSVPERGGSYGVWKQRPLHGVLQQYCTDATWFFALRVFYQQAAATFARALKFAVEMRLSESLSPEFRRRPAAASSLVSSLLAMKGS